MKPCKGCRYLQGTYSGFDCGINGAWVGGDMNEISGFRKGHYRVGDIPITDMRATTGRCGVERKLYDTNWRAFFRWVFRKRKSIDE